MVLNIINNHYDIDNRYIYIQMIFNIFFNPNFNEFYLNILYMRFILFIHLVHVKISCFLAFL
jgi:hypothetical protein